MDSATRKKLTAMMVRLADGDRSVFDAVYSGLWPVVAAFCKKTLAVSDAEDAAQQALLKVFERAHTFDRRKDALTWALSIAAWEIRTLRKRQLRAKTSTLEEHPHLVTADDPEGLTVERRIVEVARQLLGTLSELDQQTLLATFNEDGVDSVAGTTLRKRRERAMIRLRDAWSRIYVS